MNMMEIKKEDIPVVTVRAGLTIKKGGLEALKGKGQGIISYCLSVGDVFEFPDTPEQVQVTTRQVRPNSNAEETLILGMKNGKPAWFSVGNLRRLDHKMVPVHPVAEALKDAEDDAVRVEMCFGKKITANEEVTFKETVFKDGLRTDETRERKVAKLVFVD